MKKIPEYKHAASPEEISKKYGIKKIIKLASNENPLGASKKVVEEIKKWASRVNVYPDPKSEELREELSNYIGVDKDNIIIGNGSDEILFFTSLLYFNEGDEVIIPIPTFSYYEILAKIFKATPKFVPLGKNFCFDEKKIMNAINEKTKLIFICSPNNPTGGVIEKKQLEKILQCQKLTLIDEAYAEFAKQNFAALVKDYENLIVVRTFSKAFGLAGLRVGYGMACKKIIKEMLRVKQPFNVSIIAQKAALAALRDKKHLEETLKVVEEGKRFICKKLKDYVDIYPSKANFLLINVKKTGKTSKQIVEELLKRGIIIRDMNIKGLDKYHVRVSIGKMEDNERFVEEFIKVIT